MIPITQVHSVRASLFLSDRLDPSVICFYEKRDPALTEGNEIALTERVCGSRPLTQPATLKLERIRLSEDTLPVT